MHGSVNIVLDFVELESGRREFERVAREESARDAGLRFPWRAWQMSVALLFLLQLVLGCLLWSLLLLTLLYQRRA